MVAIRMAQFTLRQVFVVLIACCVGLAVLRGVKSLHEMDLSEFLSIAVILVLGSWVAHYWLRSVRLCLALYLYLLGL